MEGPQNYSSKGGDSDHNRIVLDGMPIYTSNRMFGFISGLNSNAIKDVQIFSGSISRIWRENKWLHKINK